MYSEGEYTGGGVHPRHATLRYNLDTSNVDVTLRVRGGAAAAAAPAADGALCLRGLADVTSAASSAPLRALDLFVGATLRVCGGVLVLRSCNASTGAGTARLGCVATSPPRVMLASTVHRPLHLSVLFRVEMTYPTCL